MAGACSALTYVRRKSPEAVEDVHDEGIKGIRRFLNRVWSLVTTWSSSTDKTLLNETISDSDRVIIHSTIKAVTTDFSRFHFNTAIARLMEFINHLYKVADVQVNTSAESEDESLSFVNVPVLKESLNVLIQLLGPLAPHIGEELWRMMGHKDSLFDQKWPEWDETALKLDEVILVVQINGKLIDRIEAQRGVAKHHAEELAKSSDKVQSRLEGKKIRKVIYVPNKILNFVV